MRDTQRSELISTQLRQIAEQAIEHPDRVFTSLIQRLDELSMTSSGGFWHTNGEALPW